MNPRDDLYSSLETFVEEMSLVHDFFDVGSAIGEEEISELRQTHKLLQMLRRGEDVPDQFLPHYNEMPPEELDDEIRDYKAEMTLKATRYPQILNNMVFVYI